MRYGMTIAELMEYFGTDNRPVDPAEFYEFYNDLGPDEKEKLILDVIESRTPVS